ncbi:MAG TPA: exodeoxyribonuclease VII large subunit, partial [Candidatus Omnitrophota bacterium]|nr:exodeoxyribonuclease VII large subunit [Candidatus Omnitrophota bacterium]
LISAVGHETNTTLIDFASDLRAPTPTAAAEKAVPVRAELVATVADCGARLVGALARGLEERRTRLDHLGRALPNPRRMIEDCALRLDDRVERLGNALPNLLHRREAELERLAGRLKHPRELIAAKSHDLGQVSARLTHALDKVLHGEKARLERCALQIDQTGQRLRPAIERGLADRAGRLETLGKLLDSFSYKGVLERGFAVVRDAHGAVVSAVTAEAGAHLAVEFKDGRVDVTVGPGGAPAKKAAKGTKGDGRQGSLL